MLTNNITGKPVIVIPAFIFVFPLFMAVQIKAQNAGISFDGSAPNVSAAFDINVSALAGVKKGLLIPRVTLVERTAMNPLPVPARGLMVYQTDAAQGIYYNTSSTTTPTWTAVVNAQSMRWDLLQNPAAGIIMAHGANQTEFTFDGFASPRAFSISSNSIAKGSLLDLSSNSPAGGTGLTTAMLNIFRSGANANPGHRATGIYSEVANTGAGSSNYGGYFLATGAGVNYGLFAETNANQGTGLQAQNTSTGAGLQAGVRGYKIGNTVTGVGMGVLGSASGTGAFNYGGHFEAKEADKNYAILATTPDGISYGVKAENTSNTAGDQYGVSGSKTGNTVIGDGFGVQGRAVGTATNNYGGFFSASGASGKNTGVWGETSAHQGIGVYGRNFSTATGFGTQVGVYGAKTGDIHPLNGTGVGVYGVASGIASENYGGYFRSSGSDSKNFGIIAYVEGGTGTGYGLYTQNYSTLPGSEQYGVWGVTSGSTGTGTGVGVLGGASGTGLVNVGGRFLASQATTNYAVYASASGGIGDNFALYVPLGGGHVALGTNSVSGHSILSVKNGHFQSQQTTAPTIVALGGAGSGATSTVASGSSDIAGSFTLTTGSAAWATGGQATITFNETFSTAPRVTITATNGAAANRSVFVTSTVNSFTLHFTTAASGSVANAFNYMVIEN